MCLTNFLLRFKNITLKATQSYMASEGGFHGKKHHKRWSKCFYPGLEYKSVFHTLSWERLSCAFSAWLCCSQDFCSCFKLLTALSKQLTWATCNEITPGILTQEFWFWLNLTSRVTLERVKAKEGRKKAGKQKALQLPEFPHNGIIIYSVQIALLQLRVTVG